MKTRILSYSSVEQLYARDSIFLKEYKDVIHIAATATLRKGLVTHNSSSRWIDAPILSFGQIVKYIGNRWFEAETFLKQSISLTKAYEEFALQADNLKLFAAFDKNQQQILTTIRSLVEAGISPDQLANSGITLSEEEKMLLAIWRKMEHQKSIVQFNNWFKALAHPAYTEKMVRNVLVKAIEEAYKQKNKRKGINAMPYITNRQKYKELNDEYKGDKRKVQRAITHLKAEEVVADTFDQKKVIVFHGFYFITPVQQRFIKILEASNIQVVQLIYYDERYPEIFKTVEQFLPMGHSEKVSQYEVPINSNAIGFAKAVHGDFHKFPQLREPKYTVFQQLYQFKEYVANIKNEEIFSPRASTMEKYFNDLTTSATAELKDYPIGQFLIDLHRLSSSSYALQEERYIHSDEVDAQILLRLFNSGYLSIPQQDGTVMQGKSLVKALIKLKSRFAQCRTFNDWEQQLIYFIAQKGMLERSMVPSQTTINIDNELYIYPHRDISYYHVTEDELQQILSGIRILKGFYERLYTGTNLSIKQYINQMENIVTKQISANLSAEDKKMAAALMKQIRALNQEEFEGINRKDIIKGLVFYLSHSNKENDTLEKVEDGKEAEFPKAIGALVDVDKVMFSNNRNIHLAFMDNKALPLSQSFSLWPLREETIEVLAQLPFPVTLKQLHLRKEMTGSITSYLLYMAMQKATTVHLSIVKNVENEHNLTASFYLQLMNLKPKAYVRDDKIILDEQYTESLKSPIHWQTESRESHHILNQTYNHCQRRFIASYLIDCRPYFTSDFHLRFIYQGLIQHYEALFKLQTRNQLSLHQKQQVRQLVDNLFPQWTKTRKDLYYRDTESYSLREVSVRNEIYLSMYRPLSLFGLKKYDDKDLKDETSYVPENKQYRAMKCMYCPFKLSCRESLEDKKDNE